MNEMKTDARRRRHAAMSRGWLVAASLAVVLSLPGCTQRDVTSIENGLWKMFAGHPKPIVLNKADPPVYCYDSIGEPQCYAEPLDSERSTPIQ